LAERPPRQQLVAYIDVHATTWPMGARSSSYYATKTSPPSARAIRDAGLVHGLKVAHNVTLGVYGARKNHAELHREGMKVARCTVGWLMRAEGLRGIPREKTRRTPIGDGAETERPVTEPPRNARRFMVK
jgi:transposase InsO family protein